MKTTLAAYFSLYDGLLIRVGLSAFVNHFAD
jgi:hypothetical protein